MSLMAGTRLGPYEIHSQVGAGGMGVVYRAKVAPDTLRGSEGAIAILFLPDGNVGLAVFREAFEGSIKAYNGMLENARRILQVSSFVLRAITCCEQAVRQIL
jgi:hypothetical protein